MEGVLDISDYSLKKAGGCMIRGVRPLDQIEAGDTVFFTAVGEGTDNNHPEAKDIRWIPHSFQIGSYKRYFMFDFTESFQVKHPGEKMFRIFFRKEYYDGFAWMPTKEFRELSIPIQVV